MRIEGGGDDLRVPGVQRVRPADTGASLLARVSAMPGQAVGAVRDALARLVADDRLRDPVPASERRGQDADRVLARALARRLFEERFDD